MAEVLENEKVLKAPAEPLFSKKNRRLVSNPLDNDNPITVQVLGVCSSLAVTVQMKPTMVMAIAVLVVVAMSNFVISLMRNLIPSRIRIIVQLGVVATLVATVDQILQAYAYDVSKQLSVFVGLIITNCIVMGRLEAFAMANKPWPSLLDGIGNSLGYGMIILMVAFVRELLGSGSVFGFEVFKAAGIPYMTNGLLVTPAGACIVLGLIIWAQRARNGYVES
jgi:Na+-transporting NADH:ubiquinone oxidoreductase subunit D